MTSPRTAGAIVAISAVSIALVLGSAAPAFAADGITFTPPTQTVEYGQPWDVSGHVVPESGDDSSYGNLTLRSGTLVLGVGPDALFDGRFDFGNDMEGLYLGAGTHDFSARFSGGSSTAASATDAVVTITPAKILATTTIAVDPNNPANATVNSQLTGAFVDQLPWSVAQTPSCECEEEDPYNLPAGTWVVTITDSSGKSVFSRTYTQAAAGLPTFVNYWQNVPAGETFTAQSTFTPSGSGTSNFSFSTHTFSWTSAKGSGAGSTTTRSSSPPKAIKTAAFAPPLSLFIGLIALTAILVIVDVLLLVRRRRSRRPATAIIEGAQS